MPSTRRTGTRTLRRRCLTRPPECVEPRNGIPGAVDAVRCGTIAAPATATPGRPAAREWPRAVAGDGWTLEGLEGPTVAATPGGTRGVADAARTGTTAAAAIVTGSMIRRWKPISATSWKWMWKKAFARRRNREPGSATSWEGSTCATSSRPARTSRSRRRAARARASYPTERHGGGGGERLKPE